jgi:hypothetical protein
MIPKRQKAILWSSFTMLLILSAVGACYISVVPKLIPMVLNDSSPKFGQLADEDRWEVYHAAQSLVSPIAFGMLVLLILWAVLTGVSIWLLSRKSLGRTEHETH